MKKYKQIVITKLLSNCYTNIFFYFYSRFLSSWRNGAQAALKGGASDRCLSMYAGVRPPRGVTLFHVACCVRRAQIGTSPR